MLHQCGARTRMSWRTEEATGEAGAVGVSGACGALGAWGAVGKDGALGAVAGAASVPEARLGQRPKVLRLRARLRATTRCCTLAEYHPSGGLDNPGGWRKRALLGHFSA